MTSERWGTAWSLHRLFDWSLRSQLLDWFLRRHFTHVRGYVLKLCSFGRLHSSSAASFEKLTTRHYILSQNGYTKIVQRRSSHVNIELKAHTRTGPWDEDAEKQQSKAVWNTASKIENPSENPWKPLKTYENLGKLDLCSSAEFVGTEMGS